MLVTHTRAGASLPASLQMGEFARSRSRVCGALHGSVFGPRCDPQHLRGPPPGAVYLQRRDGRLEHPGLEPGDVSSESHFCNRAQPSASLLLQLSLFLRHSSEAISLTRPAHFFFPLLSYPAQPPRLFHYYTPLLYYFFFFFCCIIWLLPCSSSI